MWSLYPNRLLGRIWRTLLKDLWRQCNGTIELNIVIEAIFQSDLQITKEVE
jgi:hypothetical protein